MEEIRRKSMGNGGNNNITILINIQIKILPFMVLIQKAEKKALYRYLLQEGVIVFHKDFSSAPHKGTNVPNIQVWMLLKSLKDRNYV